jgi:hypothetical protein
LSVELCLGCSTIDVEISRPTLLEPERVAVGFRIV